jgi:hypothetical protein
VNDRGFGVGCKLDILLAYDEMVSIGFLSLIVEKSVFLYSNRSAQQSKGIRREAWCT